MKAQNIEEFFGTLLESVTKTHIEHLKTGKYSAHKALNEYYDEAGDVVDAIIEAYMGVHGKVEPKGNAIEVSGDAVKYFEDLRVFTKESTDAFIDEEETEIRSEIDSFLSLLDSTLYKLKELTESMSNTLYESMESLKGLSQYLSEKCCGKKCKTVDEDDSEKIKELEKKLDKVEDKAEAAEKEANKAEESIKDEKSFKAAAEAKFKKVFGDKLDKDKMNDVINGILKDNPDDVKNGDWGKLIGKLNKSFGA